MSRCIATSFIDSNDQLAEIFKESLRGPGLATVLTIMVPMIYMTSLKIAAIVAI